MISIDEALAAYSEVLRPLPIERLSLSAAHRRVLAQDVLSPTDLPRFDQSAMDGYALRAADVAQASAATPARVPIALHVAAAGLDEAPVLPPGSAARILTGAPMPLGADTMIPQESVQRDGDWLIVGEPWPAGRNIRRRAEEIRAGSRVATAGSRIGAGLLAALANASVAEVAVHAQPRIRLLTSGDEVRPLGSALRFGEIHDSNGPMMAAVLRGWGHAVPDACAVGDRAAATEAALDAALAEADLVLSAGGASVGDHDHLPASAERLGLRRVYWRVAQKPAKPMWFGVGQRDGRPVAMLALPGNPGAVLIGLCLHVARVLDVLEGLAQPRPLWRSAALAEAVPRDSRRERLLRMVLVDDGAGRCALQPLDHQDSHMLGNLADATVLVRIAAGDAPAEKGSIQRWIALPD